MRAHDEAMEAEAEVEAAVEAEVMEVHEASPEL